MRIEIWSEDDDGNIETIATREFESPDQAFGDEGARWLEEQAMQYAARKQAEGWTGDADFDREGVDFVMERDGKSLAVSSGEVE